MADRYLLHKPSGVVYIWQSVYASNPDFIECADLSGELLPDPDAELHDPMPNAPAKRRKKREAPGLQEPEPFVVIAPDPVEDKDSLLLSDELDQLLSAEASKGLP